MHILQCKNIQYVFIETYRRELEEISVGGEKVAEVQQQVLNQVYRE